MAAPPTGTPRSSPRLAAPDAAAAIACLGCLSPTNPALKYYVCRGRATYRHATLTTSSRPGCRRCCVPLRVWGYRVETFLAPAYYLCHGRHAATLRVRARHAHHPLPQKQPVLHTTVCLGLKTQSGARVPCVPRLRQLLARHAHLLLPPGCCRCCAPCVSGIWGSEGFPTLAPCRWRRAGCEFLRLAQPFASRLAMSIAACRANATQLPVGEWPTRAATCGRASPL